MSFLRRAGLGLIVVVVALAAGVFIAPSIAKAFPALLPHGSESVDSQIIKSVTREQQVVLLSLGIQGISEKSDKSEFLGVQIPGSDRSTFIEYSFNAKLGIKGEDVKVERIAENRYRVSIPKFVFIGYDNPTYKLAAEDNGVLSWVTPEIDTTEMINSLLNDSTQAEYISSNEELLKDQSRVFYSSIISSVDPTIVTEFEFN